MSVKFENNSFKKRVKSMLGVDFRRIFTWGLKCESCLALMIINKV